MRCRGITAVERVDVGVHQCRLTGLGRMDAVERVRLTRVDGLEAFDEGRDVDQMDPAVARGDVGHRGVEATRSLARLTVCRRHVLVDHHEMDAPRGAEEVHHLTETVGRTIEIPPLENVVRSEFDDDLIGLDSRQPLRRRKLLIDPEATSPVDDHAP